MKDIFKNLNVKNLVRFCLVLGFIQLFICDNCDRWILNFIICQIFTVSFIYLSFEISNLFFFLRNKFNLNNIPVSIMIIHSVKNFYIKMYINTYFRIISNHRDKCRDYSEPIRFLSRYNMKKKSVQGQDIHGPLLLLIIIIILKRKLKKLMIAR